MQCFPCCFSRENYTPINPNFVERVNPNKTRTVIYKLDFRVNSDSVQYDKQNNILYIKTEKARSNPSPDSNSEQSYEIDGIKCIVVSTQNEMNDDYGHFLAERVLTTLKEKNALHLM